MLPRISAPGFEASLLGLELPSSSAGIKKYPGLNSSEQTAASTTWLHRISASQVSAFLLQDIYAPRGMAVPNHEFVGPSGCGCKIMQATVQVLASMPDACVPRKRAISQLSAPLGLLRAPCLHGREVTPGQRSLRQSKCFTTITTTKRPERRQRPGFSFLKSQAATDPLHIFETKRLRSNEAPLGVLLTGLGHSSILRQAPGAKNLTLNGSLQAHATSSWAWPDGSKKLHRGAASAK